MSLKYKSVFIESYARTINSSIKYKIIQICQNIQIKESKLYLKYKVAQVSLEEFIQRMKRVFQESTIKFSLESITRSSSGSLKEHIDKRYTGNELPVIFTPLILNALPEIANR